MTGSQVVEAVRFDAEGLIPAVVQDAADGRVLMVGWMDREALEATVRTGDVHFHSRSRGRLWRKGETSGHVLRMRSIATDCDEDTLLVTVDPIGPTCHRGTRSCFDDLLLDDSSDSRVADQGFAWLEVLWQTISRRAAERPDGSYTARLLDAGVDQAGRKVTEEATEVLLAARDDAEAQRRAAPREATSRALAEESADLLYHLLVLTAERGITPTEMLAVLRQRHGPPD